MIFRVALAFLTLFSLPVSAQDSLRVATWNVQLIRQGPGLLLRDMLKGDDAQVRAATDHISKIDPDVLLLTGFDTDADGHTLSAFESLLSDRGTSYPHMFTRVGNAGSPTDRDLDKDGRDGEPEDARSYGSFRGEGGLAVLSKLPIEASAIRDFTEVLWKDVPDARFPKDYYDDGDLAVLPLSSTNHWDVPVRWSDTTLNLLAFYANTPVFDGEDDRNGLRNADEIRFWRQYLDGALSLPPPTEPFVILGDANLDPFDGEGQHSEIVALLNHPSVQDAEPRARDTVFDAAPDHIGDALMDTADFADPVPGNLRVDYVLPSVGLRVLDAGVAWALLPGSDKGLFRNALVWVDIARQ